VGISQEDVRRVLGKVPDFLVPSDRAIPRAITGGQTILEADPRSGAARAFAELASHYLEHVQPMKTTLADATAPVAEEPKRRGFLRKGN
jgi:Flp pilus assembly CpaE family ATPase